MPGVCIQQVQFILMLSLSLVQLQAIRTVQECPQSRAEWRKGTSKLACVAGKEYHCMMTENFFLSEFCMGVRKIDIGKLQNTHIYRI